MGFIESRFQITTPTEIQKSVGDISLFSADQISLIRRAFTVSPYRVLGKFSANYARLSCRSLFFVYSCASVLLWLLSASEESDSEESASLLSSSGVAEESSAELSLSLLSSAEVSSPELSSAGGWVC